MDRSLDAARLVREARGLAGLTQRQLAERAGAAQSAIARIERGQTSPSLGTLCRLIEAAGFELRVDMTPLAVPQSHMLDDVARILRLTPEQRLTELRNLSRFEQAARRV